MSNPIGRHNNYVTFTTEESKQAEDLSGNIEPSAKLLKRSPTRNNSFLSKMAKKKEKMFDQSLQVYSDVTKKTKANRPPKNGEKSEAQSLFSLSFQKQGGGSLVRENEWMYKTKLSIYH